MTVSALQMSAFDPKRTSLLQVRCLSSDRREGKFVRWPTKHTIAARCLISARNIEILRTQVRRFVETEIKPYAQAWEGTDLSRARFCDAWANWDFGNSVPPTVRRFRDGCAC